MFEVVYIIYPLAYYFPMMVDGFLAKQNKIKQKPTKTKQKAPQIIMCSTNQQYTYTKTHRKFKKKIAKINFKQLM